MNLLTILSLLQKDQYNERIRICMHRDGKTNPDGHVVFDDHIDKFFKNMKDGDLYDGEKLIAKSIDRFMVVTIRVDGKDKRGIPDYNKQKVITIA